MIQDPHDALASQFDQYEIRRELHRERPHTTYEVTVDGRRAVCKVALAEATDVGAEAAIYDHVDRTTDVSVPSIVAAGDDWFVAEWTDALPDDDEVLDPEDCSMGRARALGASMARLHEVTANQFAGHGFPRFDADGDAVAGAGGTETTAPDRDRYLSVDARADWHALAREFLLDHRAFLADYGWADPAGQVLTLLDDRPELFDGAGTPVLCHGNIYPEHVGFMAESPDETSDVAAMIDFEHALVAPAEYDFWRTALPVFHTRTREPRPQFSAFREGYESVRSLPMGLERRREGWWLLNTVTYVTSVAVEHDGVGPDQRPHVRAMADWIEDTVASLRG